MGNELKKIVQGGEKMKEELENLGIKLAKLAKKYGRDYLTLAYVEGSVQGNERPSGEYIRIFLDEKEVEERCLKEQN